jgi:toxin-antitoxin system PIN domain toxin
VNYLIDSNILIYSKMDGMAEFPAVSRWFTSAVSDTRTKLTISETSVLSFLRICTNPKAFKPTLPLKEARKYISEILMHPNVELAKPNAEHFIEVAGFMERHEFHGNLAMDAHLAVLALSIGATLVTRDADFQKVPYLKIFDPMSK